MTDITAADSALRIGALAARTGVTVEALRYYEKRGLLRPAARRSTGYREYAADTVRRVRFIKRAQALGFSLSEVEDLVRLRDRAWSGDTPRQLLGAAVAKVEDIDRRIRQLGALRDALAELVSACDAACSLEAPTSVRQSAPTPALPCPLIEALDPDGVEGEQELPPEPTRADAPSTFDTASPSASRRRSRARGRRPARETSLTLETSRTQRRKP